jgi:hypothetical protein
MLAATSSISHVLGCARHGEVAMMIVTRSFASRTLTAPVPSRMDAAVCGRVDPKL